jgi:hypothetical protein
MEPSDRATEPETDQNSPTVAKEFFEGIRIGIQAGLKDAFTTAGSVTGIVKLFPVGPSLWQMLRKQIVAVAPEAQTDLTNKIVLKSMEHLLACEKIFGDRWFEWSRSLRDTVEDPNPLYVGTVRISFWKVRASKGQDKAFPAIFQLICEPEKQTVKIHFHFFYELASGVVIRGCKNPEQLIGKQLAVYSSDEE